MASVIERCDIPDVLVVSPPRFGDERGFFSETFRSSWFDEFGLDLAWVQDNHSRSAAVGTMRGLHFQIGDAAMDKLVRVTKGAVLDVAVDIRVGSPWFGQHVAVELSEANWRQLLVPKGFAHGFMTLEPDSEVQYKVSAFYAPQAERGLRFDDSALGIPWPLSGADVTVNDRDRSWPPLEELPAYFEHGGA
jgi:dTDP-4-dehydrorhamnose 3,5-epimerase